MKDLYDVLKDELYGKQRPYKMYFVHDANGLLFLGSAKMIFNVLSISLMMSYEVIDIDDDEIFVKRRKKEN